LVGQLGYGSYYACDDIERQEKEAEERARRQQRGEVQAAARGQEMVGVPGGEVHQQGGAHQRQDDEDDDDDDDDK
jgi:hypothetical protein